MLPSVHSLLCRFAALLIVFILPAALIAAEPPDLYATIDAAVQANRLVQTRATDSGKDTFGETLKKPGVLIGFELGLGRFNKLEVIYALRPIYLNADGEWLGTAHGLFQPVMKDGKTIRSDVTRTVQVKAKPGYAVGGLTARAGMFLNGLALRFQRLDGAQLDPQDSYASEWIGDRTGGQQVTLDSKGMVVVGIHGRENDRACQSLGLIYLDPALAGAPAPDTRPEPVKTPPSDPEKTNPPKIEPVLVPKVENEPAAKAQQQPALKVNPEPIKPVEKRAEDRRAPATPAKAEAPEKGGLGSTLILIAGVLVAAVVGGALFLVMGFKSAMAPAPAQELPGDPAKPAVNLPPELEARVLQELTKDEQIVWAAQPSPRVTRLQGLATAGGSLFMALIASLMLLGFLVMAKTVSGGAWMIPCVMGLFVVLGLAGMFLAPRMKHLMARRTWYVVTNRRALVGLPGWFGESAVDSYTPLQLQNMNRRDSWFAKGAGDLIFRTERRLEVSTSYNSRGRGSTSVREKIIRYGFLGVEDVTEVEKIVRQILVDPLVDKCVR